VSNAKLIEEARKDHRTHHWLSRALADALEAAEAEAHVMSRLAKRNGDRAEELEAENQRLREIVCMAEAYFAAETDDEAYEAERQFTSAVHALTPVEGEQ